MRRPEVIHALLFDFFLAIVLLLIFAGIIASGEKLGDRMHERIDCAKLVADRSVPMHKLPPECQEVHTQ